MKTANCPSCGAPVTFKSSASAYTVCEYCRGTLLRDGEDLKNLGRMADLLDDPTLIRIGTEGRYQDTPFSVIGRIQLQYESGLWNEWHLLFSDATTAWLSEAGGEYVLTRLEPLKSSVPAFEVLEPNMQFIINDKAFVVTDLESARCIAGEGELPFKVESGYDVNAADLRNDEIFATIDYSETPPLFFVGEPVTFDELTLSHLKEPEMWAAAGTKVKVSAFDCPHCGAPLTTHSDAIRSLTCPSCSSLIGLENQKLQLLAKALVKLRITPWLPIGSKGRLKDVDWEIIGFLQRSMQADGQLWTWSEYLLFNAKAGFAWLTEYEGHWCYARTLSKLPKPGKDASRVIYDDKPFTHFSSSVSKVSYVLGEFYWRVSLGESSHVDDYIAPPLLLSSEKTKKEVTWSLSEYLEPEVVCSAFGIKDTPPERVGVYANQPNLLVAQSKKVARLFWVLLVLATLLQLILVSGFSGEVLREELLFTPGEDEAMSTKEFTLPKQQSLALTHIANLANDWVGITTTLIEKDTGQTYQGHQELAYFSGVDEGESWSEGSRYDTIVFKNIPAGVYYLDVDFELDEKRTQPLSDTVRLTSNSPGWSNYVMLLIFLGFFPLHARYKRSRFETMRWEESGVGDDDDDEEEDD